MYTGLSTTPFFCNYFITYHCNSRCEFCNFWRDPALQQMPDARLEDITRNLDDLHRIGISIVDFVGGEPLLHKDLPDMLAYAKNLGFWVKLSTNGILYADRADELKGNVSRVYISLDATDPESYNLIRGTNAYDQLIAGIARAKELHQDICLICTFTDTNLDQIEPLARFAQQHRITAFFHPCFSYFGNPPLSCDNIRILRRYFWRPYVRMSLADLSFFEKGGNNPSRPLCRAGKSTIDINPRNELLTPCFHKCERAIPLNGNLLSLYQSGDWPLIHKDAGKKDYCRHCTIDCYFGLSYWDKIHHGFFKATLTGLKDLTESVRPH
jgi:MoaA/NifB/PqqE/SkfB family radical SAM enzyme